MFYLTDKLDRPIDAYAPLSVSDAKAHGPVTNSETVAIIAGAAGFARTLQLSAAPILNQEGSEVGSFWKNDRNLADGTTHARYHNTNVYAAPTVTSLTETNGSAAIVITNTGINLEQLFETPSGTKDFILVAIDVNGNELYGWVAGIAASGNAYTFTIYSTPTGSTQNWVGTLGSFDNTSTMTYKIFRYNTSIAFTTGTTLTTEVEFDETKSDVMQLASLANGEYAVHYPTGKIRYKKADTGTSDVVTYKVINEKGASQAYTLLESKEFSLVTPSDYNVATQQTMFASPRKKVIVKASAATTVEVDGTSNVPYITLAAGEQYTFEGYDISNIYLTSAGSPDIRVTAYA